MIEIDATERDDPRYVELVSRALRAAVHSQRPAEVYVVQIDHWFDHKWDSYSGRVLGAFGVWLKKTLTLPPFNPSRVVSELHYEIDSPGTDSYTLKPAPPLHIDQWSEDNMRRLVGRFSYDALLVWYSGGTKTHDRASLMMYSVRDGDTSDWYASFVKKDAWRLNKTVGVSRREVSMMLRPSPAEYSV